MEQLKSYQESIHEVVSKEGLEYLHGVIVGVIEHSARETELHWREIVAVSPQKLLSQKFHFSHSLLIHNTLDNSPFPT